MKPPSLSFSALLLHAAALSQALSSFPGSDAILYATDGQVTLSSDGQTPDIMVLDFGQRYEGHPTFEILSASGDTSRFEVSFGESSAALSNYIIDGPLPLAAAMETHRVKRYNITAPFVFDPRRLPVPEAQSIYLRAAGPADDRCQADGSAWPDVIFRP